jgi:hypothetical protein
LTQVFGTVPEPPGTLVSFKEVKTMGSSAVPLAMILPPRAINNAVSIMSFNTSSTDSIFISGL